jgi:anti-anti-sigma factor
MGNQASSLVAERQGGSVDILHSVLSADVHLLKINGPLNGSLAEAVKEHFNEVFNDGAKQLIVNLKDVSLIDSRGLASLVAGLKMFRSDNRGFYLAALQAQPRLVFELTGFDRVFQVLDNVAEAEARPISNPV